MLTSLCVVLTCWTSHADELAGKWAILASPEIRQAGVSDLLFVELAKQRLDLVEREQLDKLLKEVELSQLGGAEGMGHNR